MRVSGRAEAHDPRTQVPEQSVASLHIFDDALRGPTDEIVRMLITVVRKLVPVRQRFS